MNTRLGVELDRRFDEVVDRLNKRMGTLLEAWHEVNQRRNQIPNPTVDLEDVKYDIYFEWDANIFIKENSSDDAFFLAGGNGELNFDKDDEGDDMEYDEDDKEADAVWEAIDQRMDSRRKDRREARLEQEIEKYHAPNQQMSTRMSDVSIEPITAAEKSLRLSCNLGVFNSI
ncbi:hypothetical protein CRG98_002122 [Punica granatum]|uniref:PRP1 splicing factor N-terminal domain-containing protein n=1 Tax=Punica granatum TaxID=22663 RepID=A0A2I0LBF9_PUNGR|nr:hypothetical protein CRG98_002122 [Punica granatum]